MVICDRGSGCAVTRADPIGTVFIGEEEREGFLLNFDLAVVCFSSVVPQQRR